ncbi:MAG: glycosyltransferase family 4 protein [Alterinioella nitratireducens]|uniref:glycosyltransferase family 4 protein n=1 Tax=Alterinioella nitratireducens TaxID=2735915 RepID=UPI004059BC46
MTRFAERLKSRLGRVAGRTRGFRGNVDGFVDGALAGWVAGPEGAQQRVGVFTAQGLVAQGAADLFRNDLRDAGIGTGHHGFSIPVDPATLQAIRDAGGEVRLRTLGSPVFEIGRYHFAGAAPQPAAPARAKARPGPEARREDLRQVLFSDVQQLKEALTEATETRGMRQAPALAAHGAIFGDTDYIHGGSLPEGMTAYAEYVRYRYKLDETFDTLEDPAEVAHFLNWYIAGYSTLRGGLRVPISKDMLDDLNAPVVIGGQRASLTRATWSFLMGVPPILHSMDFQNPDWVLWAVYWWSINQARALNCEDCLVPQIYIDLLAEMPERWQGESFAPSQFMLRLHAENAALGALDLTRGDDRRTLLLAIMAMAVTRPDFLRYVPAEALEQVLNKSKSGAEPAFSTFFRDMGGEDTPPLTRADLARILRLKGFDLETRRFVNFTPEGHRIEAAMLTPVQSEEVVDLQLIGPFEKASGLGQATRLSASVLAETGLSVNAVNFGLDNPAPEGFSRVGATSDYKRARINLIHLNAESIPLVFAYEPDAFSGAYNIGYFFWELDTPAACHYLGMDMLDEIWVSTEYGVRIYQPEAGKPVTNVGMCYEDLPEIERESSRRFVTDRFGFDGSEFVFLVAFDSFSFVQRKNPVGTLKAFCEAFEGVEDVRLVIKTQNRTKVQDPAQQTIWAEVDRLMEGDDRIVILDETLSYDDLLRLKKGSDCYVSLHKSEGWGFGMIEAMNLGVPVVCTGYSGNMDFCRADTAWLVGYEEVELGEDDYIFVRKGQKWAEPDHEDAVRQLRAVYDQPEERDRRAQAALALVKEDFSAPAIARRYEARLREILEAR